MLFSWEVQIREFFVVYFCCFVVCFCGFDFICEVSEGDGIAVGGYFGNELLFAGVEAYTFVFRAGIFSFFLVAVVLGAGCWAEVRLSIVEAVMVDVVNDAAGGDFYYTAVHVNGARVFFCWGVALGVTSVAVLSDVPSVLTQLFVIFGVNDCKLALCQGYAAERIAVAEAAPGEHSKDQYAFDSSRDGNNEINFARSAVN